MPFRCFLPIQNAWNSSASNRFKMLVLQLSYISNQIINEIEARTLLSYAFQMDRVSVCVFEHEWMCVCVSVSICERVSVCEFVCRFKCPLTIWPFFSASLPLFSPFSLSIHVHTNRTSCTSVASVCGPLFYTQLHKIFKRTFVFIY